MKPIVSVVLGSYNRLSFLKLTINSIREELLQLNLASEIIVIDGGSTDGALEWLTQQKDIITIVQHNRGVWEGKPINRRSWGYFMNLGFKCAQGKYICMLSDDCLVVPGAIQNGYTLFEKELMHGNNIGAIAFYWKDWSKDLTYHVGNPIGHKMYVNHGMYLRSALEAVGFIEEEVYQFYFADIDVCFKLWHKGYICVDSPNSYIEHYPHAALDIRKSNTTLSDKDFKVFLSRWQQHYPDLTNHNISICKTKTYQDTTNTGNLFNELHQGVLITHKKHFRSPSLAKKVYLALSWKLKMAWRKTMLLIKKLTCFK